MVRLQGCIKRVHEDESGASLAEYAVLLIIVAVAGVGGVQLLGKNLDTAFTNMATWITTNVSSKL
ncbi:MAG: hypothetical protein JWN93_484 [Hyphomicrobiales bacterium]|nr:hypothetical protein [Hyphomicrobiales bacterium]